MKLLHLFSALDGWVFKLKRQKVRMLATGWIKARMKNKPENQANDQLQTTPISDWVDNPMRDDEHITAYPA